MSVVCCVVMQECCRGSVASCCTGVVDPVDELTQQNVTSCPCKSCWQQVAMDVDHAVKTAAGIGLFFSFTEVPRRFTGLSSRPVVAESVYRTHVRNFGYSGRVGGSAVP